jgi:hypothetical protein
VDPFTVMHFSIEINVFNQIHKKKPSSQSEEQYTPYTTKKKQQYTMGPPICIRTRLHVHQGRLGRHRVLVGFTNKCAISVYHH